MKKLLLSVVAVGAVGGAVAGLVILGKKGGTASRQPAELVPENTIAFVELPNLTASGERWKQTSLYKLSQEPEVKAFLEQPLAQIPQNATLDEFRAICRDAKAEQIFFALTSLEQNKPLGVAGLRYSGGEAGRAALGKLIEKGRAKAREASPSGKAGLEQYNGHDIESFSDADITVAGVFVGDWYFLSNDLPLLKATLDRLSGAAEIPTLAGSESYQKSIGNLPGNTELRGYLAFSFVAEKLIALTTMQGQEMSAEQIAEMKKVQGVAFSTSFDGDLLRDTVTYYAPGIVQQPKLTGATDVLTAAGTSIYGAMTADLSKAQIPKADQIPGPVGDFLNRLSASNIGPKELEAAFGPEWSFSLNLAPLMGVPNNYIATEVKDQGEARRILGVLLEGWAKKEQDGVTYWTSQPVPLPMGNITTVFSGAMNDRFFLFGWEAEGSDHPYLKAAFARAAAGGENLTNSPAYQSALKTVRPPGVNVAYIDAKGIFEGFYNMGRLTAAFLPPTPYADLSKLPQTETITRHLHPIVMSQSQTADGGTMESTGTVTISQGTVGLVGLGVIAAQTVIPMLNPQQGQGGGDSAAEEVEEALGAPQGSPGGKLQESPESESGSGDE